MRKVLLPILLLFSWAGLSAQSITEQADSKLREFLSKNQIPGLSISVSQKGQLVFSKGYGHIDWSGDVPVDPSTSKFRIGSVSKTLTASGLALLYEQGKVDLDASIDKYVPIWPDKGFKITLRMLAGHLAGIRHYKGREFYNHAKYETVADGLSFFIKDPLINTPGTEYSYSSYGWNLISVAMENAAASEASFLSSKDFLTIMIQDVFEPLGMINTVPDHADQDIPNRTKFYEIRNGKPQAAPDVDNSYKWAGGGFLGTTEDLCRFGQAHMKAGFLKQNTLDEWMTSQKTSDGKETNYGIGWRIFKRPGGQVFYGHTGGSVGGSTRFIMHKESETVLAITANIGSLRYNGIEFELMELFTNN